MSWGAFNICSEDHAIHHNADKAGGATIGVRYPGRQDDRGIRFWTTPMGAMLEKGRIGRRWGEIVSWMYNNGTSPATEVTYEAGANMPPGGTPIHIRTIAGVDVSHDSDYYVKFYNQCDRLMICQNAYWYDKGGGNGYGLDTSNAVFLFPAQVASSNVLSSPDHYNQRPYSVPTLPGGDYYTDVFPNKDYRIDGIIGGRDDWRNSGWCYKRRRYNNGRRDFYWIFGSHPEWEDDSIWDGYGTTGFVNPTAGLDKNLLYLMQKTWGHGPGCTCSPVGSPAECNDRILVGYRPHYWMKTSTATQHYSADALLYSWNYPDEYNYIDEGAFAYKQGYPPYSISCGNVDGYFAHDPDPEWKGPSSSEPWYAKTDDYQDKNLDIDDYTGFDAMKMRIPPNTAFDLVVYLENINYIIFERAISGTHPNYYHAKHSKGYYNTRCYSFIHQIAPLQPI